MLTDLNKYFFFKKFSKNILIFFPMFFAHQISIENIINCIIGFVFFSFMVNICYLTNNLKDSKIDKKNLLKKNSIKLSKKFTINLNILLICTIFLLSLSSFFSYYIIFYLILFYLYTFFLKFFFIIDIFCLSLFYILRILYGVDLVNIEISFGFLGFFFINFFILAIYKRIVQINLNRLKNKNKIIVYKIEDLSFLKKLSDILCLISLFLLFIFLFFKDYFFINIFYYSFSGSVFEGLLLLLLLSTNMLRIRKKVFLKQINKDIIDYTITDPFIFFSGVIFILILIPIYI